MYRSPKDRKHRKIHAEHAIVKKWNYAEQVSPRFRESDEELKSDEIHHRAISIRHHITVPNETSNPLLHALGKEEFDKLNGCFYVQKVTEDEVHYIHYEHSRHELGESEKIGKMNEEFFNKRFNGRPVHYKVYDRNDNYFHDRFFAERRYKRKQAFRGGDVDFKQEADDYMDERKNFQSACRTIMEIADRDIEKQFVNIAKEQILVAQEMLYYSQRDAMSHPMNREQIADHMYHFKAFSEMHVVFDDDWPDNEIQPDPGTDFDAPWAE